MAPPLPPKSATVEWSWGRTSGDYVPYDATISKQIEEAHAAGEKTVHIIVQVTAYASEAYRIDFSTMRQINLDDPSKRRAVRRTGPPARVQNVTDSPVLVAARDEATAAGVELKSNGTVKGYHLTNEAAATSIIRSSAFLPSSRGAIGPFISFANTPTDCVGKATAVSNLEEGALLTAQVDLGYSLVVSSGSPSSSVRRFLDVTSWSDLTPTKLLKAGCQSVYAKAGPGGLFSRDEWAVPLSSQISGIQLSAYHKKATPAAGQPVQLVAVPFWQWPGWVNNLATADNVGVDHMEIDSASPPSAATASKPTGQQMYGVRVNAAGRPVHSDGKFMSFKEAMRRGWGAGSPKSAVDISDATTINASPAGSKHYSVSSNPTGPLKKDGSPDMRYAANRAPAKSQDSPRTPVRSKPATAAASPRTGSGTRINSGSAHYSVSSNPTGPLKADGTPDMRFSANRASSYTPPSAPSPRSSYLSSHSSGPLKKDGTPDMRYAANRSSGGGGGGGGYSSSYSPQSYKSSYSSYSGAGGGGSSYSSGGGGGGYSGSACYSVSSNPTGPTKADGTPDMRYSANRR